MKDFKIKFFIVDCSNSATQSGTTQQQDWNVICDCFDKPYSLMFASTSVSMSKIMNDVVANAVTEMRRCYSRKIVDILIKVTKQSLDELRKHLSLNLGKKENIRLIFGIFVPVKKKKKK